MPHAHKGLSDDLLTSGDLNFQFPGPGVLNVQVLIPHPPDAVLQ